MNVYPPACDDILCDFLGGVKIPNVKLLKKRSRKGLRNFMRNSTSSFVK